MLVEVCENCSSRNVTKKYSEKRCNQRDLRVTCQDCDHEEKLIEFTSGERMKDTRKHNTKWE